MRKNRPDLKHFGKTNRSSLFVLCHRFTTGLGSLNHTFKQVTVATLTCTGTGNEFLALTSCFRNCYLRIKLAESFLIKSIVTFFLSAISTKRLIFRPGIIVVTRLKERFPFYFYLLTPKLQF